jgi:type IV secretory pathway VirB4 component
VLRKDKKDKSALRLADRLQRFITGSMAGLFSRPTNVALDVPLLDFDLREMRGGSEIKPAGIFLISEFLWTQALYQPKPRRCYIDEAWSLIRHQEGGVFLERMAREFRKHAVSVVTITQNPEQFVTDPHGSVIAQNAYTKVLKRLDTIGSRAARTAFGLSQTEEQRLTTLDQKKALFLIGSKRLIVEMTASPEEYVLAHTDPGTQPPSGSVQIEPVAVSQAIPTRSTRTRGRRTSTRSVAATQDAGDTVSEAAETENTTGGENA